MFNIKSIIKIIDLKFHLKKINFGIKLKKKKKNKERP